MKVKNSRSHTVTVAPAGQQPFEVGPNKVVEVDDELGKAMLDQPDNWAPVSAAKKES